MRNGNTRVVAAVVALSVASSVFAGGPYPDEVREARAVYRDVLTRRESGQLEKRVRTFEYCEGYEDGSRTLYVDPSGAPRLYEHAAGSGDSSMTWHYYYDGSARLRFAFLTLRAVDGTHVEHRIWFRQDGQRVREERKLLEGPGWPTSRDWPDERLVSEPLIAFEAPNRCPERGVTRLPPPVPAESCSEHDSILMALSGTEFDRLTVDISGTPCAEAIVTFRILSPSGQALLYEHTGPFAAFHSREPPSVETTKSIARAMLSSPKPKKVSDLLPYFSGDRETQGVIWHFVAPEATVERLRPQRVFRLAIGSESWLDLAFDPEAQHFTVIAEARSARPQ